MGSAKETTRLLIVEEYDLLRQGLEAIIRQEDEFEIVGSTSSPNEAVNLAEKLSPNIIIFGLSDKDSVISCSRLLEANPSTKILCLAPSEKEEEVISVIKKGASGCLMTDVLAKNLVQAIRLVAIGQTVVPQSIAKQTFINQTSSAKKRIADISLRELEVFQLMANGLSNKEIAGKLCLSESTVKTHVSRILRKLGKANRTAAILYAAQQGLLDLLSPNPQKIVL